MNAKILAILLLSSLALTAAEITVTVGPSGEVKTVEEGLAKAREKRQSGDTARILISGTHFLQKPLLLTEADSDTTLQGSGKAVLSGGRLLMGWTRRRGPVWEMEIPEVKEGKWYFRQLFVNGERRQRARTPNTGYLRIQGPSPLDKPIKLKFRPGDIKKEWAQDGDVEVVAYFAWADIRMQIRAVDEVANIATLAGDPKPSNQELNAQYFIENAPDGLDAPGEWHLNRKTGLLRYWPMPGERLGRVEIIAPVLDEVITVRGNAQSRRAAERIELRGLTFAHTDYQIATNGYADVQAAVAVRGDVLFEFAKNCLVQDCTLKNLAGYGVELGRGAQGINVRYCEMVDLGAGGVRIGETVNRHDVFHESHSHQVTDNHLYKLGRIFAPGAGVLIAHSGTNVVSHNHIHDLYYTGVSVGWTWAYNESPCRQNIIEFNHIHDLGKALLSDMAGVYTLGIQRGTVVRNNLIYDVNTSTYGGFGLYTDEGSSDILLESNIVYRCKNAGFFQHFGRDNIVRNNIFAFGKEGQIARAKAEQHNSFRFENNIVFFDSGDLLGYNWTGDKFVMDRNIYFDARPGSKITFSFQKVPLDQWRARGHDRNSQIVDPLFVNAKKYDFRLRANSPALKMGFKPIDVSTVGPRKRTP